MLILGYDIGSEIHYVKAIDTRGREFAGNHKNQIVLGLEPTGHYWFCLATWMISNGISVV